MTKSPGARSRRLVELDALRGIAATLVMLFHYTTRYEQIYGHETLPSVSVPWGHYGVNLFFMISGFVIFMTLHRVKRPMDFIVSRFSRLFPAFWAAIIITFLLTHAFALPDKTVSASVAGMNLFMIHGLFKIPHVDGVYWTLEIELIFYAMALLLYLMGRLDKVHAALLTLLMLRLAYFLADRFAGIELSWTLSHILILPYIAWFVCGIMIYRLVTFPTESPRKDVIVLVAAIVQLTIVENLFIGLLAACLSLVLLAAVKGRLSVLANPVLAWLGAISYTLYLLHENIGWGIIMHLERAGLAADLTILMAIAIALALASALTWLVERPAMSWLRQLYRLHPVPVLKLNHAAAFAGCLLMAVAGLAYAWHQSNPRVGKLEDLTRRIFLPAEHLAVPCQFLAEQRPLMVFVLGQSNAANHGEPVGNGTMSQPALFFFDGKCYSTSGPAPGATGQGGNLWTYLGPELAHMSGRPVIFSVLAVESTQLRDWVEPGDLRDRLAKTIANQRVNGFIPDLVLWQQGEADAKAKTTRSKYIQRFGELTRILRNEGIQAPIIVALSTHCRNDGSESVRSALNAVVAADPTIRLGPDTDSLVGLNRRDDCHFSTIGQRAAAELWLASLAKIGPNPP